MKLRNKLTAALFLAIVLGGVVIVYAQKTAITNQTENSSSAYSFIQDLASRIKSSGFEINGTIVDSEGVLLNDVKMGIVLYRPILPFMTSSERVNKEMKVDSKFSISEKGFTRIELTFYKKGYYVESRSFSTKALQIEKEQSNPILQKDIQIKMTKKGIRAERISFHENLQYNIKDESKKICDLSVLQKKTINKDDKISLKTIDLKTTPETKYIELDFKRDSNGKVIYDGKYDNISCPSEFIIRFHSNDPEDGFILINDENPSITEDDYDITYTLAPEKGYTKKEISIKLGEKVPHKRYPFEDNKLFIFLKCGKYYGKAMINRLFIDSTKNEIKSVNAVFKMGINRKEGDRNLTFY